MNDVAAGLNRSTLLAMVRGRRLTGSFLEERRLSKGYKARLASGWNQVVQFASEENFDIRRVATNPRGAEDLLVRLVSTPRDRGSREWLPRHAVLAAQTRPRVAPQRVSRVGTSHGVDEVCLAPRGTL